ncbi:MAG: hypothetical protein ABW039_14720 [Sphingobium sp.]
MSEQEDQQAHHAGGVGAAGGPDESAGRALSIRRGPHGKAQKRRIRSDGWTPARRRRFIEALVATCNVSEAARVAGRCLSSAYNKRRREPGFAREWEQALAIGYDELETALLRDALFGCEDEELTLDGEGVLKTRKVKRGRDRGVALRLLTQHRATRERMRGDMMREAYDGEAARAQLRAALEAVRGRSEGDSSAAGRNG